MDSRIERILAKQKEREELMRKKEEERKQKEKEQKQKAKVLQVFKAGREEPETVVIIPNKATSGEKPEVLDARMSELRWERKEGTWVTQRDYQSPTQNPSLPPRSSMSALENKAGTLRWKKTVYGWSRQDEKYYPTYTPSTLPSESPKEVNCYQTSVTPSYLPRNVYESIGISSALQRKKDFVSACRILSELIIQWFPHPSSLAAQSLMFNDLMLVHFLLYNNADYLNAVCYRAAFQLMESARKTLESLRGIKTCSDSGQDSVLDESDLNVKEQQTEPRNEQEAAKVVESIEEKDQMTSWKCTVCTFLNEGDHNICMMCDRDRVLIMKEKAKRELSLQDQKKWEDKDRDMEQRVNSKNTSKWKHVNEWCQSIHESLETQFAINMPDANFQFDLPYELIFTIFSFLTDEVDLITAQLVCKQFHKIASDDVIYKLLLMKKYPNDFCLIDSSIRSQEVIWKDALIFTYRMKEKNGAVQCMKCGSILWRQMEICNSCSTTITQATAVSLDNVVRALLVGLNQT